MAKENEKQKKAQSKKTTEETVKETVTVEDADKPEIDISIETDKQDNELEKIKSELEKQKDLALRTAAEFDNFKKRTEREKSSSLDFMKADIVKTFLPVLDNFGRALASDRDSEDFTKGIEMISKQLTDAMVKLGLSEINDDGKPFDPAFHQAVLHIDDESLGESVIVSTLQKGYKIGDTVIRPAMVQVAN